MFHFNWLFLVFVHFNLLYGKHFVKGSCFVNNIEYKDRFIWQNGCLNCTCFESVPICQRIKCKYEICEHGKLLVLSNQNCCPTCQEPRKSCQYNDYLIQHNTEFSPELCKTCKCKNGLIECENNCIDQEESFVEKVELTNLKQRQTRLEKHHHTHKTRNHRILMYLNNERLDENSIIPSTLYYDSREEEAKTTTKSIPQAKSVCLYENKIYPFNTIWSPLKCAQCKCNTNSNVECYVKECPNVLDCNPEDLELKEDSCCPTCKNSMKCIDHENNQKAYNSGDYWNNVNDPCEHCSCNGTNINCFKESCDESIKCASNEILVSKSNRCCPECESKRQNDNCEYYGKNYLNGEIWYTKNCQHCACNSGKVTCMNVECESKFCMKNEILVRKKNDCCMECRQPITCQIKEENLILQENEFWIPADSYLMKQSKSTKCKICQCTEGKLSCYLNSCENLKYPTKAHIFASYKEKKEINARTIPFFADIIKTMKKDSMIFVVSGPTNSNLYIGDEPISVFKLNDIIKSKVYFKFDTEKNSENIDEKMSLRRIDHVVLSFVSSSNGNIHNILILFELKDSIKDPSLLSRSLKNPFLFKTNNFDVNPAIKSSSENDRSIRNNEEKASMIKEYYLPNTNKMSPRKTIFIQPSESIKLTSNELKPKNLGTANPARLIYYLVSGSPKFGELKLKKVVSSDDQPQSENSDERMGSSNANGWNQINDIYLEKTVKEFTQQDLDNGNVWYEPLNNNVNSNSNDIAKVHSENNMFSGTLSDCLNRTNDKMCAFPENCEKNCHDFYSVSGYDFKNNARYDHCMFEVYDQDNLEKLISKEILHFAIRNEIINETVLGLEVVENQITPLTFSNFDIAGIDSSREYLIYRIVKGLESEHGHLEHADRPGISIDTFTQSDLNKGLILYVSPKEIGVHPKELFFTFIVTNDNRSDTFPETPFHIKVLPSNDQSPEFKETVTSLVLLQSGSLILQHNIFDVDDPDTAIENIVFTIEQPPENSIIELRTRGQRYVISKDDSFTVQEVRDGTFRLVNNGANRQKDLFKVSASDGKHITIKTINIEIQTADKVAPNVENRATMLLNLKEGHIKVITRDELAFVDDKSSSEEIMYKLVGFNRNGGFSINNNKLSGKFYLRDKILSSSMTFTQADIDLQNLRYEAPLEIGHNFLTETLHFDVNDKEGNILKNQMLTVKVEPVDNQPPTVEIKQSVKVLEGSYMMLNESLILVQDIDSAKEQLNIIIDLQPNFGFIENIKNGKRVNSFSLVELLSGLAIRYVQNDHKNKEPNSDVFIFHVTDGINQSPNCNFLLQIEPVNDEPPKALFQNLLVNLNSHTIIDNSSFLLADLDSNPEEILIYIEQFPKYGKLFYNYKEIMPSNNKIFYSDILGKLISYKLDDKYADKDKIKFKITDGFFSIINLYEIRRANQSKLINDLKLTDDILPPIFTINRGIKVTEGKSVFLSRADLDVKDADTSYNKIFFNILKQAKYGRLENMKEPGKRIDTFTYEDLSLNRIRFVHLVNRGNEIGLPLINEDWIELKATDGKNEANANLLIKFVRTNTNSIPLLKSPYSMQVKELSRKQFSIQDLNVIDIDTPNEQLKIVITHPPQYGTIEKNANLLNIPISEFLMSDLIAGNIYYNHRSPGMKQDRFGFIVTDGYNNVFIIDNGIQVANYQVFKLEIMSNSKKEVPRILNNLGLEYLFKIDGVPGRLITKNELLIQDLDDFDQNIRIEVTSMPKNGYLENKDKPGVQTKIFTQLDISQNKIYYILTENVKDNVFEDYFEFDVYDSANNSLKNNQFNIKWSMIEFEESEISVMENEGKARVHVKKFGHLKHFSLITCKTLSDTAKSNRDAKTYDFMHSDLKIEFNTDESYKACDVIIHKDTSVEGIESFFLVLEESKYSVIGNKNRVKINILENTKESTIEFENTRFVVQETDKFITLPIKRSGDLFTDEYVECITYEESALSNQDFVSRNKKDSSSVVKIAAGEIYAFCDIEIIDDKIYELETETFKVILANPSAGLKLGYKSEVIISISGPNDYPTNDCKTKYLTVNENEEKLAIDLEFKNLNEPLEVICFAIKPNPNDIQNYLKQLNENENGDENKLNVTHAIPNEDYIFLNQTFKLENSLEANKKIFINILNDIHRPIMEGLKMFSIEIKPLGKKDPCFYINPNIVHIVIDDRIEDMIQIGFDKTETLIRVNETNRYLEIPIRRYGDVNQEFSVVCSTHPLSALDDIDYISRPINQEQSKIFFKKGEIEKNCLIEIIDDSVFEADETFLVKLTNLKVENAEETNYRHSIKFLNDRNELTITILNDEDASVVYLSSDVYYTDEPTSSDTSVVKPLTIIRTGDLSRITIVRISTSDDTASAGQDYKQKTELIKFNPGVSALDFEIEILYDELNEPSETFLVTLGPLEPVSGIFGKVKSASVIIRENSRDSTGSNSNLIQHKVNEVYSLFDKPYLTSLKSYLANKTELVQEKFVANGEPLICVHACDKNSPNYQKSKCESFFLKNEIKIAKMIYAWEISTPMSNDQAFSPYTKLTENTFITYVNESVIEPFYFQMGFRVRCTIQLELTKTLNDYIKSPLFKSPHIEVTDRKSETTEENSALCMRHWKEKSLSKHFNYSAEIVNQVPYYNLKPSKQQPNIKFDKPFLARADYISAEFLARNPSVDTSFLNYIRLTIDIPFIDGVLPLVSTKQLYNYRYLLTKTDHDYHLCSNFLLNSEHIRHGFINNKRVPASVENKYRNEKTLDFFSNLDSREKCSWTFVAFYDISELTTHCQAQILSDMEMRDYQSDKNYLAIKIPLFVSYVYAGEQTSWSSIEYKSELDVSIVYRSSSVGNNEQIKSFPPIDLINSFYHQTINNNNDGLKDFRPNSGANLIKNKYDHLVSLKLGKMALTQTGRLVLEFSTIPAFFGQFVKSHHALANVESFIIGPDNERVHFNLDLIWSQYTYEFPEQTWKAVSNSVSNSYSGNYTISLIPCHAKNGQAFKYPFECVPQTPLNFTVPIIIEQILKPIPLKYSLGTQFTLSKSQIDCSNELKANTMETAVFDQEDKIFGTVKWTGGESIKRSLYKLELETVYLCSTINSQEFVPTYDPDGTIYKDGPQFGCSKPNKFLKHRILLLNREKLNTENDRFEAKFLKKDSTRNCIGNSPITAMDGFEFNLKNLFILDNRTNAFFDQTESLWYIQAIFVIRPFNVNKRENTRAKRISLISTVYNNGTNIQSFRLVNKLTGHKKLTFNENGEKIIYQKNHSESNALLKILIPLIVMLVLIFALVFIVYLKKRTLVELIRNKEMRRSKKEQISNFSKNISFKKIRKRLSSSKRKNKNKKKKINLEDLFEGNMNEITHINTNDNKILDARILSGENENCSGTNSTSDTIIIASPLLSNKLDMKQKSLTSLNHSLANSNRHNKLLTKDNYNFQTSHANSSNALFNNSSFNNKGQIENSNGDSYLNETLTNNQNYEKNYENECTALYDNNNDLALYDGNIYQFKKNKIANENGLNNQDILNLAIHKHQKYEADYYEATNRTFKKTNKPNSVIRNLNSFKSALQRLSSKLKKSTSNLDEKSTSKYIDSDVYTSCTKAHPLLQNLESSNLDSFNSNTNNYNENNNYNNIKRHPQSNENNQRKNYLYFNYTNNKMSYFNSAEHDLTFNEPLANSELTDCELINTPKMMITSTPLISEAIGLSINSSNNQQSPELLSTSSTKLKRLSGTEV